MKTVKPFRFLWVVVLATSLLLASCGPAATTPAPTAAPTEAAPTEAAPTEAVEPTAAAEPVELVYWAMWNETEPQGDVIKDAVKDFETANPGVTVKVQWNGRDIRKLIVPALESGENIDLFDNDQVWINGHAKKYLLPLDSYLDQPAVGEEGRTVGDTLNQALLGPSTSEGKLLNVPYQPYAVMFFYNKEHFETAGITKVPETWDEFLAANEALKKAGFAPITTDVDSYLDVIIGYYAERAKGCDFFMETLTDKTGEMWRDPAYLQMAQDIQTLNDKGYIAEGTSGNLYPAGQQQLALGEVTMYLNGTWLPTEVKDTAGPDFQWGAFSFPTVKDGENPVSDIMMGSQGIAIMNTSQHPDQAFEFIKYLVSKKTQAAMTEHANVPAIHVDVPWAGPISDAGVAVKGATKAIGWACDLYDAGDVVSNVVIPQFQDLFVGKITPEQYVENTATKSAEFWASQN